MNPTNVTGQKQEFILVLENMLFTGSVAMFECFTLKCFKM